jgi:hypothetical protein
MALLVINKDGEEFVYHVDSKITNITIVDVVEVEADNDELERIINYFNVPVVKGKKVHRWYGPYAQHIAGNWYFPTLINRGYNKKKPNLS